MKYGAANIDREKMDIFLKHFSNEIENATFMPVKLIKHEKEVYFDITFNSDLSFSDIQTKIKNIECNIYIEELLSIPMNDEKEVYFYSRTEEEKFFYDYVKGIETPDGRKIILMDVREEKKFVMYLIEHTHEQTKKDTKFLLENIEYYHLSLKQRRDMVTSLILNIFSKRSFEQFNL